MARRRPSEPTANPARGAALVVVAVVIGLFLLREGLDTSEAVTTNSSDQGSDSSDSGDEGTDGTDGTETTTTTVAGRPPGEVPTIVLNDSGVPGAAGKYSDVLAAAGYQLTNPDGANADAEGDAATTVIYFAPDFEAEAAAVATAIGAPDTVVPDAAPHHPARPDRRRQRRGGDRHRPRQRHADHRRAATPPPRPPPRSRTRLGGRAGRPPAGAADGRGVRGLRRHAVADRAEGGRRSTPAGRGRGAASTSTRVAGRVGRRVRPAGLLPRRAPPGRDRAARALRPRGAHRRRDPRARRRWALAPGRRRGRRRGGGGDRAVRRRRGAQGPVAHAPLPPGARRRGRGRRSWARDGGGSVGAARARRQDVARAPPAGDRRQGHGGRGALGGPDRGRLRR